ncbi:hypothetical protein [Lentimicrobium sp. S6]|uniref:hypothetical protein n=1 Tax=Lentimicrobium sp. S6 TaxID=2735872 RepID=UPI0015528A02|nr:hypothetical protein [Lentimicrobium sp. S6]NPD44491.1 hypothetical protein [Lentimicrobium sp. S6]
MEDNTHKEFDQIFRDKLQNHEVAPPAHIWTGVQAEALSGAAGKSSQWRWWAAASLLGLLLSTAGYFYLGDDEFNSIDESTPVAPTTPYNESNSTTKPINMASPSFEKDLDLTEEEIISEIEKELPIEEKSNSEIDKTEEKEEQLIEESNQEIKSQLQENFIIVEEHIEVETEEQVEVAEEIVSKEGKAISNNTPIETNINKEISNTEPTKAGYDFFDEDALDDMTQGHRQEKYWELGLEFSPEWVTIPDNNNNIQSYGLDLSAKYHIGKLFLETGLGASLSKDDGIYHVDYQEAVFKGSYQDVYNVTFDTSGGTPVPTYYTKLVNIYDTLDKATITENKNTYAYLNIPINIGYYTPLGKKFSFYAKTGLNASILIYQDIPTPSIEGELNTIIKTTPLYHQRTDWNLQAQINVGINYHITENFRFGLEPNARYYIKSLVESNNSGNPYGLGVKIGFKYVLK